MPSTVSSLGSGAAMSTSSHDESIFNAALDFPDPQERAAYLDQSCREDPELRRRVELLLSAYGQGQFLESPAAGLAATAALPAILEKPGATIGPYKLLEQIGEGGMGLVFMAEQSQPLRRRVALKIIKPGLDTRAVIARFEAERQALALMDHPNIARVYDAGATETGRPYFVMELVRGVPITDYCRDRELSLHDRLELFIEVCQAVQHAHQKGVIHRDLKPTNLLVAQCDTKPIPKVIDFGVAKATTQSLTEQTLFTHFAQIIGTPLYMSPEQADLGNQDIDTRSDVYSLGVVLYELLTGATPFDATRLKAAGLDEMRRIIREEQAPRPSLRPTTSDARMDDTHPRYGVPEPQAITLRRRRELDWIVLKALEKDRSRRYQSASEFAADLRRFLDNEVVGACPPSWRYRLGKFSRQHRVAILAGAAVAAALATGLAASIWQATRATQAEARAQRSLAQARQAVDDMYTGVAEKWLATQASLTEVQREFLGKALQFYDALTVDGGLDADLQFQNVRALNRMAPIQRRLEDDRGAEVTLRKSLAAIEGVVERQGDRPEYCLERLIARRHMIELLYNSKREEESLDLAEMAVQDALGLEKVDIANLDFRQRLGEGLLPFFERLAFLQRLENADRVSQFSFKVWQSLVDEKPDNFEYRLGLARMHHQFGSRHMTWTLDGELAEKHLRLAEQELTTLHDERPTDYLTRHTLWGALNDLGATLRKLDRHKEAVPVHRRALEVADDLVREAPSDFGLLAAHHKCLQMLATSLIWSNLERPREVYNLRRRGLETAERMLKVRPKDERIVCSIAFSNLYFAIFHFEQGEHEEAIRVSGEALERMCAMANEFSHRAVIVREVRVFLTVRAALYIEAKRHADAVKAFSTFPAPCQKFIEESGSPILTSVQLDTARISNSYSSFGTLFEISRLFHQCAEFAKKDESLPMERREQIAADYVRACEPFQREAERALRSYFEAFARLEPEDDGKALMAAFDLERCMQDTPKDGTVLPMPSCMEVAGAVTEQHFARRLAAWAAEECTDRYSQHMISAVLSTAPPEFRNPELALLMARRAMEQQSDDYIRQSLRWALYRAGKFEESLDLPEGDQDPAENDAFVVMALWQVGRREEARSRWRGAEERLAAFRSGREELERKGQIAMPQLTQIERVYEEAKVMVAADIPPTESTPTD